VRKENVEVIAKFNVDDLEGTLFNISLDFRVTLDADGDDKSIEDEYIEIHP
jgi:hypothetical protein